MRAVRRAANAERQSLKRMLALPALALGLVGIAIPTAALARNATRQPEWAERTFWTMGTSLSIRVEANDRQSALAATEAAYRAVQDIDAMLSSWRPDTEVGRLNATPAGTVFPASSALASLLPELRVLSECTDGTFDPVIGALVEAWGLRGLGREPSADELRSALERSGIRHLRFDERAATLTWTVDGAWLDAGAFGKGAALRAARTVLESLGIHRAHLDFGGQVLLMGADDTADYLVAVAHPHHRSEPVVWLRVRDASVASSGQSERFVEAAGRRVGHVLDPRTGLPAPAWGSVTVVAADPLLADAVSTALLVMGPEDAKAWADTTANVGVLLLAARGDSLDVYGNTYARTLLH